MRKAYQSDLSDAEWSCLQPHLPAPKEAYGGRPRLHSPREILEALLYILKSGCAWRRLASVAPRLRTPWRTVYHYFRTWRLSGLSGRGGTRPCANGSGCLCGGTPSRECRDRVDSHSVKTRAALAVSSAEQR
jgi:transposase